MTIHLDSRNAPSDKLTAEAAVSDLFFNYQHDEYDRAKQAHEGNVGDDVEAAILAGLKLDAIDFANTVAIAFGWNLDTDELVADFVARL